MFQRVKDFSATTMAEPVTEVLPSAEAFLLTNGFMRISRLR